MVFRFDRRLTAPALLLAGLALAAGCGKKRAPALASAPGGEGSPAVSEPADRLPASPVEEGPDIRAVEGEAAEGADIAGADIASAYSEFGPEGGPLEDVRFGLDSAGLTDAARATLEKHALWLQSRRDVQVTIEGHCDERGTVEYNLALGEQRARAARDYLVSLGVAADRLRVVSYGKERPLDRASTEEAWARNRRAHFAVHR